MAAWNWNTALLSDFLTAAPAMTVTEFKAQLRDLVEQLGVSIPVGVNVGGAATEGPDAAGAVPQGNPLSIAGVRNDTGALARILTDLNGTLIVQPRSIDDAGNNRAMLSDRAGILALGQPVSKIVTASQTGTASIVQASLAAPGAGLRNVVLAWTISVACGATALAAGTAPFSGTTSTGVQPAIQIACPVNDCRIISGDGPLLGGVNTVVTLGTPTLPAGALGAVWITGYIASFP